MTLFIVFATLLGVLLIALISFAFYHFSAFRKRKQKQFNGSGSYNANKEFVEYNALKFTYDTSVETQQTHFSSDLAFHNKHNDYRGDESTASESSFEEFNEHFLKSIDLVQPSSEYQRSKSSSASGSSELIDVFVVDKSINGGGAAIRPQSFRHKNGLGKLSVSLFYDKALELLRVNVIQWFDISSHGLKSTISPYVKVQVVPDNDRKFFTKTKGGENPVFDEEFSFPVSSDDLNEKSLHLSVCDFDKFSRQNILANGVAKLSEYVDKMMSAEGTGELSVDLTESDELVSIYLKLYFSVQITKYFTFCLSKHQNCFSGIIAGLRNYFFAPTIVESFKYYPFWN